MYLGDGGAFGLDKFEAQWCIYAGIQNIFLRKIM